MPLYEYYCFTCGDKCELVRRISQRNKPLVCKCGENKEMIVSVPTISIWNSEREFPNLTGHGNGSMKFSNNAEYQAYLKEQGVDEFAIDGKIRRPHGNTVIGSWK